VSLETPANLFAAVQVAAAPQAAGAGVLVVANDEIHAARFVRKTVTASPATFRSISAGPVGWVVECRRLVRRHVGGAGRPRPGGAGVRTGGGEVLRETYGFPGSERDLLARGSSAPDSSTVRRPGCC
jgi:hypothetical protein